MKQNVNIKKKNPWWINRSPEIKSADKMSFSESFVDLLQNASMHCYQKLVEPERIIWEKFMWLIIHIIGFATLFFLLSKTWESFTTSPLITSLYDPLYPISSIPFPAVTICPNNRMSKRAVHKYATTLSKKDPENRNATYFFEKLEQFKYLYNVADIESSDFLIFQNFLDTYDLDEDEQYYNTRKRMLMLSPNCSEILLKCYLAGKVVPCMSSEMFKTVPTHRGYCCAFNLVNTDSTTEDYVEPFKGKFIGPEMSLVVVLNASDDDNFMRFYELNGFIVFIYHSDIFNDVNSGAIKERFIARQSEAYIAVTPKVVESDIEIMRYDQQTRDCLFDTESHNLIGTYSLSKCVTSCRLRSMRVLCRCIPFFMPIYASDVTNNIVHCTLEHVPCLNRYKFKWSTVVTKRQDISGLEIEMEDGLYCPECKSPCSDVQYGVAMSTVTLTDIVSTDNTPIQGVKNLTQISVIRVFFGEPTAWFFKQSVRFTWFEMFSSVGGICGFVTGFSLAAGCEIIYFFLKQISRGIIQLFKDESLKSEKREMKFIIYP